MKPQLDMISVNVTDLERMVAFYRDVFGLEVKRYKPGSPFASFQTGAVRFSMYCRDKLAQLYDEPVTFPSGVGGSFSLALKFASTEELTSEAALIIAAGARPMHALRDESWGIRSQTVADPEGNLVELFAVLQPQPIAT